MRTAIPLSLILGALLVTTARPDEEKGSDDSLASFVDKRVKEWQPTAEERRFDEIGWCHNILDAERLAREHNRPIFLFTHDGKMNVGRC